MREMQCNVEWLTPLGVVSTFMGGSNHGDLQEPLEPDILPWNFSQ